MNNANELANTIEQLLSSVKGASRLASDEKDGEEIIESVRVCGQAASGLLQGVKSTTINSIPEGERTNHVIALGNDVQGKLLLASKAVEGLIVKDASAVVLDDIGDAVEKQMLDAAQAIEAATARLMQLMNNQQSDINVNMNVNVNNALLSSAMAITSAIGQLMKAATLAQQEIVAKGRGTASSSQFYKKNNRWTEGLVSAAKTIAIAITNLVETADGITKGTHTMEQLVVAAHEVAAATAQLVAASRVKADRNSKTQENLEKASKAVTEATKALVRAAKEFAQKKHEEENKFDFSKISLSQAKKMVSFYFLILNFYFYFYLFLFLFLFIFILFFILFYFFFISKMKLKLGYGTTS